MKKVKAFMVALVLFSFTAYGLHIYSIQAIGLDNNAFSTWSNKAKFNSPDAIAANLNENSLVVFGSSEFQHGQKTIYHPKAVFRDFEFNPMLIGAGYYQTLEHTITLAAIGDSIQNKKVVLLLSPTWFRKEGIIDTAFSSRFSESSYLGMLKNDNLSLETKEYIRERTNKLLKVDPTTLKRVNIYNRVLDGSKSSFMDDLSYSVYENFLIERERQGVLLQARLANIKSNQNKGKADRSVNWGYYALKAEEQGKKYNKNPYYMSPKGYEKVKGKFNDQKVRKKANSKDCYANSPEYDDLRCFLDVCKQMDIEPLIVALPVNGYWYEHNGFPADSRTKYYNNIRTITNQYGVKLVDLSNKEYTKYFFEDSVHLGGKGWVTVNEVLYNYYSED